MNKTIIKFWDNEDYNYPYLEVENEDIDKIKKELKEYQQDEEYNFDDFINLLKEKGYKIRELSYDLEWFF